MTHPHASHRTDGRGEAGSAYIVALLALVVLSIIGLSLALITQSEMSLGANERTINRVFYGADSGIAASTARALVAADYAPKTYSLKEEVPPGLAALSVDPKLEESVAVSPFFPILESPCNLCEINNAGSYSERSYLKVNYAVTAEAVRQGVGAAVLAGKTISAMVEVQPWKSTTSSHFPIDDPTQLEKIKF